MIDHGGEGGHPVNQIFLSVLGNVLPVGVRFSGKIIGDRRPASTGTSESPVNFHESVTRPELRCRAKRSFLNTSQPLR